MSKSYKTGIWVRAAVIGASIALFTGAFYWLIGDLGYQSTLITEHRVTIAKNAGLLDVLAHLKGVLPDVQEYKKQMDKLLPVEVELLNVQRWIDGVARVNQVESTFRFQPGSSAAKDDAAGFERFSLDVLGANPEKLFSFLKYLETKADRFMIVLDSIDVTARPNNEGFQVRTQGKVFFR